MQASRAVGRSQRTLAGVPLATLALLACATPAPRPAEAPLAPGALRVELHFGAEADLDLYVTDPALESVYFANSPTRLGGVLERDLRCDAPPPRVEAVVFETPPPGRYRVGVDFPQRCRLTASRVAYTIVVRGDGLRREERGEIDFGRFESIALEFDVPGGR